MKSLTAGLVLALAGYAAAHGYVYRIDADNTMYVARRWSCNFL